MCDYVYEHRYEEELRKKTLILDKLKEGKALNQREDLIVDLLDGYEPIDQEIFDVLHERIVQAGLVG